MAHTNDFIVIIKRRAHVLINNIGCRLVSPNDVVGNAQVTYDIVALFVSFADGDGLPIRADIVSVIPGIMHPLDALVGAVAFAANIVVRGIVIAIAPSAVNGLLKIILVDAIGLIRVI